MSDGILIRMVLKINILKIPMTYWYINPYHRFSSRIKQHRLNTYNESRGMAGAESAVCDRASG